MSGRGAVYLAHTPALADMCCIEITLAAPMRSSHAQQPQVIKCRELIFTEPDILATPMLGRDKRVLIILPISLYKTGRLQNRIQKMGITVGKPKRVTTEDFQACFTYTMIAKIAPLWNKVGEIFIQGRDFVACSQKLKSIRVDVTVVDQQLCLALSAKLTRNPPINLESLCVCPLATERFFTDDAAFAHIPECTIQNQWCHVLPSMKKGQVVNVRRCLPRDGTFQSYKDIKKYWKNMYGYRLPDTDEGMLYYQVYFKLIGNRLFTYPEVCLRSQDLMTFNCPDTVSVMKQFLTDIQQKMATVCGKKIHIEARPMYPEKSLTSAQELEDCNEPNLTTQPVQNSSQYKPTQPRTQMFTTWTPSTFKKPCPAGQNVEENGVRPKVCSQGKMLQFKEPQHCVASRYNERENMHNYQQNNGHLSVQPYQVAHHSADATNKTSSQIESTMSFNKNHQTFLGLCLNKSSEKNVSKEPVANVAIERKIVPVFKAHPKDLFQNKVSNPRQAKSIPLFKPNFRPKAATGIANASGDMFANIDVLKAKLNFSDLTRTHSQLSSPHAETSHTQPNLNIPCLKPSFKQSSSQKLTPGSGHMTILAKPTVPRTAVVMATQFSPRPTGIAKLATPSKRKLQNGEQSEEPVKKPRSKPKIQANMDVASLAANNQLDKLNTATLLAWLRERSVPCKSKDKKQALVEQVKVVLNVTAVEQ